MEPAQADQEQISPPANVNGHLILYLLIAFALAVQLVVYTWKKHHSSSYQISTLIIIWLVPLYLFLKVPSYQFVSVWVGFSLAYGYYTMLSLRRSIEPRTPRRVFAFFKRCSLFTCCLVAIGYLLLIVCLFLSDGNVSFWIDLSFSLMGYGMYFGLLGRDLIDLISGVMAISIGYYRGEGMPLRGLADEICAVCGGRTLIDPMSGNHEKTFQLGCGHRFHDSCIRGWSILGKKESCPYCRERIDLSVFRENPWQSQEYFYGRFLDFLRGLILWQPLILIFVKLVSFLIKK